MPNFHEIKTHLRKKIMHFKKYVMGKIYIYYFDNFADFRQNNIISISLNKAIIIIKKIGHLKNINHWKAHISAVCRGFSNFWWKSSAFME